MKYLIPILFCFVACNSTKQAAKHLDKAFKKDRVYVAKVTRDSFPCTDLLRTDTAFVSYDSTVYIECPDYGGVQVSHDTIINKIGVGKISESSKIIIPVTLPIRTQIITKYFEDSAKIILAKNELIKCAKLVDEFKGKASRRKSLIIWLIGAVAILTATNILFIKAKLK